MMRAPTLLLALLIALPVVSKDRVWWYTMEGYVYDRISKDVLRNTTLMIGRQMVTTDDHGWYSVRISGITCDRGNSRTEFDRCNEAAYDELHVRRLFSATSTTIRTNWKAHACLDRLVFTPPCLIARQDIFVP